MTVVLILLAGGFFLTIGDIFAKKWVLTESPYLFVSVLFLYLVGLNFLVFSYRYKEIAPASITLEIFNVILLAIVGTYLYKERISRTEIAGIVLGILSVIIMEL